MKCPECKSDHINKNGHRGQKQNYIVVSSSIAMKQRAIAMMLSAPVWKCM